MRCLEIWLIDAVVSEAGILRQQPNLRHGLGGGEDERGMGTVRFCVLCGKTAEENLEGLECRIASSFLLISLASGEFSGWVP